MLYAREQMVAAFDAGYDYAYSENRGDPIAQRPPDAEEFIDGLVGQSASGVEALAARMETEVRPLLRERLSDKPPGYNCCGCSTYDDILDHCIAIVRFGSANPSRAAFVADLTDPDPCLLDHDGNCQTHAWFGSTECPHATSRESIRLRASVDQYEEYLDRLDDWLDGMCRSMPSGRPPRP